MTTDRLAGRTILVVGAGTQPSDEPDPPIGNGRAISVTAAREGARVVCADRDEDAAAETASLVRGEGGEATVVVGDVRSADDCAAMVDAAVEAGSGRLEGVVLNVGIGRGGGLSHTSAEDWDLTFAVNLRGHFLVAREAAPRMAEGGAFVFVSSLAGLQPGSRLPAYDASKAGIIGLCRHVALGGRPPGRPRQRDRAGADRHAAGPERHPWPAVPGPDAHPPRAPGHRLGGGVGDVLPAVRRGGLRHGPGAGGGRRALAALTDRRGRAARR